MNDEKIKAQHTIDLVGCARCHGEGHKGLVFNELEYPVRLPTGFDRSGAIYATHWAPCPTNGEPILMAFVKKAYSHSNIQEGGEKMDDETETPDDGAETQTESEQMEDSRPAESGTAGDAVAAETGGDETNGQDAADGAGETGGESAGDAAGSAE